MQLPTKYRYENVFQNEYNIGLKLASRQSTMRAAKNTPVWLTIMRT